MITKFVLEQPQIEEGYGMITHHLRFTCTMSRELVGGLPATKEGIEAFVKYQAQVLQELSPEEQAEMVDRVVKEELGDRRVDMREIASNLFVGEKQVPPPTNKDGQDESELDEKIVGQVNVLRKDDNGPWIGDWMPKACLKQTASRLGLWMQTRGLKGDMSEGARVVAVGRSLVVPQCPHHIYLRNADNTGPAKTFWQTFQGRIQGVNGPTSIVTHAECVEPGATFEFEYMFLGEKMKEDDVQRLVYLVGNTGLGSSRAMERGKFVINKVEYVVPEPKAKKEEPAAEKPSKGKKLAKAA